MTERKTAARAATSDDSSKVERLEKQLADMKEMLDLLKFQAESVERQKKASPDECHKRAQEVIRRSEAMKGGKHLVRVERDGLWKPIEFKTDETNMRAVKQEFEERFGTVFRAGKDKIELVKEGAEAS